MAVSYREKQRSLEFGPEGATATRVLEIAGSDLEALCVELFGATFITSLGFTISKRLNHPVYDWLSASHLGFAAGDPDNPPAGSGEYALMDATIQYTGAPVSFGLGSGEPEVPSGTYLSHSRQATAEMMTLPGHGFRWGNAAGDPVGDDIDTGIVIPTITHDYTWYKVTDPPFSNLDKYLGTVNEANTPYVGANAETYLFAGYTAGKDWDTAGETFWTVGLIFVQKHLDLTPNVPGGTIYGWNHFWRPNANPPWQKLWNPTAATAQVYRQSNFTNLFNFE